MRYSRRALKLPKLEAGDHRRAAQGRVATARAAGRQGIITYA